MKIELSHRGSHLTVETLDRDTATETDNISIDCKLALRREDWRCRFGHPHRRIVMRLSGLTVCVTLEGFNPNWQECHAAWLQAVPSAHARLDALLSRTRSE